LRRVKRLRVSPSIVKLNGKGMVKHLVLYSLMGLAGSAMAEASWFTIMGDAANPAVDTIEVDAVPVTTAGHLRTLRVRVSRAQPRQSWDGVPYRSYRSEVVFDCKSRSARYSMLEFFHQPGWAGQPHNKSIYAESAPRWMAFVDVEPNPTERIIRAACQAASPVGN
jgi:hypothetical protein